MRKLNKHIDSIYKVLDLVPFKDFLFKLVPLSVVTILIFYMLSKIYYYFLFIGIIISLFYFYLLSESADGENGFYTIKMVLRFKKRGNVYYEKDSNFKKRGE